MDILIADDSKSIRTMLESTLKEWGYKVISTINAEEAYKVFQQGKVNFLILDWDMPGKMLGIDLAKRIRMMDLPNYIYIIMLTARKDRKDFVTGLKVGVDDYIIKPFKPEELKTRILMGERILKLKQEILDLKNRLHLCCHNNDDEQSVKVFDLQEALRKLDKIIDVSKKKNVPLGIVVISIKSIKETIELYGKFAARALDIELKKRLKMICSQFFFMNRISVNDYIVAIPNYNKQKCQKMKEEIIEVLGSKDFNLDIQVSIKLDSQAEIINIDLNSEIKIEQMLSEYFLDKFPIS